MAHLQNSIWEFPQIRGTFSVGPNNKVYSILGLYLGNYHIGYCKDNGKEHGHYHIGFRDYMGPI